MIFGLTGKLGAGKNEAARRLALISPIPVVEVSYAAKLKESVAALFGITLDQIEEWKNDPLRRVLAGDPCATFGGDAASEVDMTFRQFLQRYGTEAHRDVFGQDFWLDAALPLNYGRYNVDGSLYVVTDCRFPNEAKRIKELGGWVIRIIGPNDETGDHPSETQEIPYDWKILNTVRDDEFDYLDSQLHTLLSVAGVSE
jgi:hypothetical protein